MYQITPNRYPINWYIIFISLIAGCAGILFGFDTGNIAGALLFIKNEFHTSVIQDEIIVSITILFALIGSVASGSLTDQLGRKSMLAISACLFIFGSLLGYLTSSVTFLIVARAVLGVAIGISSYVAPLYISEMAPANFRGFLVLLYGIGITSGECLAFISDYYLASDENWRMMIAAGLIPAIMLLLGISFVPESFRLPLAKGNIEKARAILKNIRKSSNVENELAHAQKLQKGKPQNYSFLWNKKFQPIVLVGISLGIFQQFVGINTIMYYGPIVCSKAGFTGSSNLILATFGLGLINALMSAVTALIIDRVGRRFMLLVGTILSGISLLFVSYLVDASDDMSKYIIMLFLVLYIIGYCISLGSLFWLIISEIFPMKIRSIGMSLVTGIQWGANFIVTATFLSVIEIFGSSVTFLFFSSMCFLASLFVYFYIPETKGVTLEEIERKIDLGFPIREIGIPSKKLKPSHQFNSF